MFSGRKSPRRKIFQIGKVYDGKRAALPCRAEVEKTRCGCQKRKLISSNIGSRSISPTAAIGGDLVSSWLIPEPAV
jgi:hypothetical protein